MKRADRMEKTILKLFIEDGYSISKISKKLKMCRKEVSRKIKDANLDTMSNAVPNRIDRGRSDYICKLFLFNHLNIRQISDEIGVGEATVSKVLRRRNINSEMNSISYRNTSLLEKLFHVYEPRISVRTINESGKGMGNN